MKKKVRCIENKCFIGGTYSTITMNKKYNVTEVFFIKHYCYTTKYYTILDDQNENKSYEANCFIDIRDERKNKLKKLENLTNE